MRGYPDFWGQAIHLRYGAPLEQTQRVNTVAGGGGLKAIFDLDMKGRIYGGLLRISGITTPASVIVFLEIDSQLMFTFTLATAFPTYQLRTIECPYYFTYYDPDGGVVVINLSRDFTCEQHYRMWVKNEQVGDVGTVGQVLYTILR